MDAPLLVRLVAALRQIGLAMNRKNLYFVWTRFQRRALAFEAEFNCDIVNLPTDSKSVLGKMLNYLKQTYVMIALVIRRSPNQVWVQLPPNFLVLFLLATRLIMRQQFRLIADCHNAAFRRPWLSVPFSIWSLNRCDLVVVHNADVLEQARNLEICEDLLLVIEDAPAYISQEASVEASDGGFVLVPCSFRDDEPIAELLAAAKECSDVEFVLTGPIHRAEKKGYVSLSSSNVKFAGFVDTREFDRLVWESSIVVGLTKIDGIQLSVAGEAIGAGKPLVLSRTETLQRLFGNTALFCANTGPAIADAISGALQDRARMSRASLECREDRIQTFNDQAANARRTLEM